MLFDILDVMYISPIHDTPSQQWISTTISIT